MSDRVLILAAMVAALICACGVPAQAKVINLGTVSRSDLQTYCMKAGGESVGINDLAAPFGCKAHQHGIISCSPAGACQLFVEDLVPVTGNSLATILGLGPSRAEVVLPPVNRVQQPIPVSPKVRAIKAISATSPVVPIVPEEPAPVQSIPSSSF